MNKLHIIIFAFSFIFCNSFHLNTIEVGTKIDTYNGVDVYFNGKDFTNVTGRNVTEDGYNLGLKFQCVEFVKRYYYKVFNHKMPNAFGHAKDFLTRNYLTNRLIKGLMQYRNVREYKPQINDILVYDKYPGNSFGHVAIISHIDDNQIEIVQQNMGLNSRIKIPLVNFYQYWTIADYHILGWLRKE